VASNVRPFIESSVGDNIYLCSEEQDWIDNLSRLVELEQVRHGIGNNAYADVRNRYNVIDISKKYVEILEKFRQEYKRD
jgi:glycosyltransferase involved in cell wall biosynthesis